MGPVGWLALVAGWVALLVKACACGLGVGVLG